METTTTGSYSSRTKQSASHSVLSFALEAGERQSAELKTALLSVGSRLEDEMKRSDHLESKLQKAISRITHTEIRLAASEMARQGLEQTSSKANEELRRVTSQLEQAKQELLRAQACIDDLGRARDRAIVNVHRSQATARKYELALNETDAILRGRQQGRLMEARRVALLQQSPDGGEPSPDNAIDWKPDSFLARGTTTHGGRPPVDVDEDDVEVEVGVSSSPSPDVQEWQKTVSEGRKEERRNATLAFERYLASRVDKLDNDK